jgi:DNA-directed RNA polymerase specialized sigma24 family protein
MSRAREGGSARGTESRWRDAHALLADEDRWAASWEVLLLFEEASESGAGIRELLEAGLSVPDVARRLGVPRNTVKQAAFRLRQGRVTPRGV